MTQHSSYSILLLLSALLGSWHVQAQTEYNTLKKAADGLYFIISPTFKEGGEVAWAKEAALRKAAKQ